MNIFKYLLFLIFPTSYSVTGQPRSIPNQKETAVLLKNAIKAGYEYEQCDLSDSTCIFINRINKWAFDNLADTNIKILKVFSLALNKEIKSYDFINSFDKYFTLDTVSYMMFFFKSEQGKNKIFGAANMEFKKSGIAQCSPIIRSDNDYDDFINFPDIEKAALVFRMSFENPLFVKDNRLYAIVDNRIIDGNLYFKEFSIELLNRKFRGVRKDRPIYEK